MDNTLMTIVAIFLTAILIFVIPLMAITERNDDVAQTVIQTATVEFVDKISVSGEIKPSDYEEYIQKLNSTGNTYDVEIEVQHLDGNFGKKNGTTSKDLIGENERYSTFTTEILESMYLEDGTSESYVLKKGDNIIVTAKNNNRTMAQTLRTFLYKVTGQGTYEIAAISSGMVLNGETGRLEIATTREEGTGSGGSILDEPEIEEETNGLPWGWEIIEKPSSWINENVIAIREIATGEVVALPEGYELSKIPEEQTTAGGLVVTDGINEFVWIPVKTDFATTYKAETNSSEPFELTHNNPSIGAAYDSQKALNQCYGEGYFTYPQTFREKVNVNNTFAYLGHYTEMVESVNRYDGFYVGRYETTIDSESIGSKKEATVLTANSSIEKTNNKYCRWWGLYAVQRNANVVGNGTAVQSNMIWGQQWDAMITYFGDKDYSNNTVQTYVTAKKVQNAGQSRYTYNGKTISDQICNIYDLRGNVHDWTAEANSNYSRVIYRRLLQQRYESCI